MDKFKHSVIIKGLPYHKDAKDGQETRRQTQENISKLLLTLVAGSEVGVTETLRFSQNEDHKDCPGLVRLTVSSSKQKARLYESLTKSSKKASYKKSYSKLSVSDEVPLYFRAKQIKLEKQAYDIRRNDKTIRTRVFLKGTDIVLKTKGKEDNMFKEYEESSDEDGEYEDAADSQPQQQQTGEVEGEGESLGAHQMGYWYSNTLGLEMEEAQNRR